MQRKRDASKRERGGTIAESAESGPGWRLGRTLRAFVGPGWIFLVVSEGDARHAIVSIWKCKFSQQARDF